MGNSKFFSRGFFSRSIFIHGGLILGSILITGCLEQGGVAIKAKSTSTATATSTGTGTDTSTATDTSTSTSTGTSTGTQPLIETTVRGTGYVSTTYVVKARKVLKIRFKPGVQDKPTLDTGFYAQYSKLGVYIQVNGFEQPTPMLSNGYSYDSQQESKSMDFSTSIPASSCTATSDASCRESVTITITKPNYDYWCYNFGMYCPWAHVYQNHPWNGQLRVQTDDTVSLDP